MTAKTRTTPGSPFAKVPSRPAPAASMIGPLPRPWAGPRVHALTLAVLAALGGCAPFALGDRPEAPALAANTFWRPPTAVEPQSSATVTKPPTLPADLDRQRLGLADVLTVALANNPATRAAWADAQAAAAGLGSAQAAYLPSVSLDEALGRKKTHDNNAATDTVQQSQAPSLTLSWLLFDFGGRDAVREKALQTLLAANWTHNSTLQDTILAVEKAYFQYLAAKAAVLAGRADRKDSEQHLAAAEALHQAGTATQADVLQMKTTLAQARLALQTAQGTIFTTRGALATAMGVPATIAFDIDDDPGQLPPETADSQVDELIVTALAHRPDLAATRARFLASVAQAKKLRADGLPTVAMNGSAGATWFRVETDAANGPLDHREDTYAAGLILHVPLFTGYANSNDTAKAEAEARSQAERARLLEQQVILQVFQSYYTLQTALEKVRSVADLLASAEQSAQVAAERYKEGVGTVLDLVTAQSALTAARAQQVEAGWQWRSAAAQLTHDTGMLGLDGDTSRPGQALPRSTESNQGQN